jgi:hypothetical protein
LAALDNVAVFRDPLRPASTAENTDMREVEPSGIGAHERGGALPVVSTALALAESTAGVKPAGGVKRTAAAKSEALAPGSRGVARREVEKLLREGKHIQEPPPAALSLGETPLRGNGEGIEALLHDECMANALLREGECKHGATPQEQSYEIVLSLPTWERSSPWDPEGVPPRERVFKSKEPVEPSKDDRGQRHPLTRKPGWLTSKSAKHNHEEPATHLGIPPSPSCRREAHSFFILMLI